MSDNKNIGGRPGVIVLNVTSDGGRKWSKSRKPVQVEIIALTTGGGEILHNGARYRIETMPGFPAAGVYKFTEVREAQASKYPPGFDPETGLNDEGLTPAEAGMLRDIMLAAREAYKRGEYDLVDAMEEFLYLHRRDEKKAHKFYRRLKAEGWRCDRNELLYVQAENRRRMESSMSEAECVAISTRIAAEIALQDEIDDFEV